MSYPQQSVNAPHVTFADVLRQLRTHNFAVLSTVDAEGHPHSAGVNYGVSRPGQPLALYVMTRTHLKKARNIAVNPRVSLVIPISRRVLWFLPPPTIQLHCQAEVQDGTDAQGTEVFRGFWMGRRILQAYARSHERGETRVCFLKITPEPVIATYLVGYSIWEVRTRMESGAAKVVVPPELRSTAPLIAMVTPPTSV
jgi:pyridoxamine 5'-phosphate oxidase-like protein